MRTVETGGGTVVGLATPAQQRRANRPLWRHARVETRRRMRHFHRFASPFLAVCAATLCAPILAVPERLTVVEARAGEAQTLFRGVGTVTEVNTPSATITVDHGEIPGYMQAMEMAYKVNPPALVDGLKTGDRIAFTIDGKTSTIVEIRKVGKP